MHMGRALAAVFTLCALSVHADAADVVTFATGKTPSSQVFVAPTGDDATGTGSATQPFRSIARAVDAAVPGTAIQLAPGDYAPDTFIENLAGTSNAPIWIRGTNSTDRARISGGGQAIHFVKVHYLVVENLEVTGTAENGLNCDDGGEYGNPNACGFVVFRNLYIHDIGTGGNEDGLKLSGLNDYWVLDSEFARCGGGLSGSGIDHVGCHRGLIAGCYFHEMSGNAVQCKGGSEDITITRCRIVDAGERGINIGGSTGFEFFRPPLSSTEPNVEARNIRVTASLFKGTWAPIAFVGSVDSLVANNTLVNPENWVIRILQETVTTPPYTFLPCSNSVFMNNVVYYDLSTLNTHCNVGDDTAPESFLFTHNLWYAHNDPGSSAPVLPTAEVSGIVGQDPLLTNVATTNYGIDVRSPACKQGLANNAATCDAAGLPYLPTPSIGAYEISGDLDGDGMPDVWELLHFGNTNRTATADYDGDMVANLAEYVADTVPTNPASLLRLTEISCIGTQVTFSWTGGTLATQYVERLTGAITSGAWSAIFTNPPPTVPVTAFVDATRTNHPVFYRVRVTR